MLWMTDQDPDKATLTRGTGTRKTIALMQNGVLSLLMGPYSNNLFQPVFHEATTGGWEFAQG